MSNKEVNAENITNLLGILCNSIEKEKLEEFDESFPKVREWIEKYCNGKPYDIAYHFDSVRLDFRIGCRLFLPDLKEGKDRKHNYVVNGIFSGDFLEVLELKCEHYTDMVRKFFNAVYKQLTTNEIVNVYKEYTEEEITKWYNESGWAKKKYASLEKCLNAYVGKPKMSLEDFKTSQDIIDWYVAIKDFYRKMCKAPNLMDLLKEMLE